MSLLIRFMLRPISVGCGLIYFLAFGTTSSSNAASPSPSGALKFRPVQEWVQYDLPNADAIVKCTVKPEKTKGGVAWVVRGPDGQTLRRFTDTNGDKTVDQWSYYKNGLEVYRDIDANFNGKADQYRWCHTGGTRWGVDQNGDGRIDYWQTISAEEVAEEAVLAIKTGDPSRFARLLLTEKELVSLGLSKMQQQELHKKIRSAAGRFASLVKQQQVISPQTTFVDFGGTRPGTIPAGTNGLARDVTVYENVAAFFETAGKHEQLVLGTMIQVSGRWRLIDAPTLGNMEHANAGGQFFFAVRSNRSVESTQQPTGGPSEVETRLMAELEKVDRAVTSASGKQRESLNDRRADILEKLADATKDHKQQAQWLSQLADTISAEVQTGAYTNGLKRLKALQTRLVKEKAHKTLIAHVVYRRLSAEYGLSLQAPKADYAKIQERWLKALESFAKTYPTSPDASDALLQLGMAEEFAGENKTAAAWYGQAVKHFPKSSAAKKAAGAIRRLGCVGREIEIRGPTADGGMTDLAELRGKVVLVQYWATWCEPCKADMALLKELYAKYGGRGFAILGVNLDHSSSDLAAYLDEHRVPWKHIFEEGGLDSRSANTMGIITLPTMILVNEKGKVLHRNIHAAELSGELKQLLD